MSSKREAYNNLPPDSQRNFRVMCLEWARRYADLSFATVEAEDKYIDFVLEAIENGEMILEISGRDKDATFGLVPTEKGQRLAERLNAEMN